MKHQNYRPKIISVDPFSIVPFHDPGRVVDRIVYNYLVNIYVPPIPIIHAPADLKDTGKYVNYNGHHRTSAARKVAELKKGFMPTCILLENWQDICYLRDNPPEYEGEIYPELIEGLDESFEAHRDFIWEEAKRFRKLSKIAHSRGILYGYS